MFYNSALRQSILWLFGFFVQVGFDEEDVQSITDAAGFINRENFMKFAKDTKLVDFGDRKDETCKKEKDWAPVTSNTQVAIKQIFLDFTKSRSLALEGC